MTNELRDALAARGRVWGEQNAEQVHAARIQHPWNHKRRTWRQLDPTDGTYVVHIAPAE